MSLARAIDAGDAALLPSRRDEDWRWSDLRGLIRSVPAPSATYDGAVPDGPFKALAAEEIVILNGRGPASLTLAPDESQVWALRWISASGAGAHAAALRIELGEGARLTLLESCEGLGEGYLADSRLDVVLAAGARLERIVLAADAASGVSVATAQILLGPGSVLEQTVLTDGARRQRLETRVIHPGAGAQVRLDGLYLLADRRHADQTTVVSHAGAGGVTDQLTKGVVDGQGRGVFQGRIVVEAGADQTDARMGHHALILSDQAEIDAKPELLIWADDVACGHGNTVGALDEEALFYARQRGLPEAEARALLIGAFVGEVVDRIGHDGAREVARGWVEARLGGEGAA
jgi:Fe-S cluster assembly protein SufD